VPLLVDQAEQTPYLLRRKMYGHVELQQQHVVGAAAVRALDEAFRELPVGAYDAVEARTNAARRASRDPVPA